MAFVPKNPRPFLQDLTGQPVVVRLKWGETEYRGNLISTDSYMNIQLDKTEEYIANENKGTLGMVLIRCNNVLFITKDRSKDAGNNDTKMED